MSGAAGQDTYAAILDVYKLDRLGPHRTAALALLRIHWAAQSADGQLAFVAQVLGDAVENPPYAIWSTMLAEQTEDLAKHLEGLAAELRKGSAALGSLQSRWKDFIPPSEQETSADGLRRQGPAAPTEESEAEALDRARARSG